LLRAAPALSSQSPCPSQQEGTSRGAALRPAPARRAMDPYSVSQAANPAPAPVPLGNAACEAPVRGRDRRTAARTAKACRTHGHGGRVSGRLARAAEIPRLNRERETPTGPTRGALERDAAAGNILHPIP